VRGIATHVALDLLLAGETKQIAGRLPKVLAAAHLALPSGAVDSMEQVVGRLIATFTARFIPNSLPQPLWQWKRLAR
jgi:hypothetical protein